MLRLSIALLVLFAGLPMRMVQAAEELTVFAAASMTDAMTRAGESYRAETGTVLRFSFASSSTLAKQIEQGAPADLFLSASESWMDYLAERGLIVADSRAALVSNALVLIAPEGSTLGSLEMATGTDLAALLGQDGRLALGDPDHVPAGIYAKEALQNLGQWQALQPRLARADNVRAALALVARGEAPLGIVYSTDAAGQSGVKILGRFPQSSHKPISYPVAIMAGHDSRASRAFLAWLKGEKGMGIMQEYGFIAAP